MFLCLKSPECLRGHSADTFDAPCSAASIARYCLAVFYLGARINASHHCRCCHLRQPALNCLRRYPSAKDITSAVPQARCLTQKRTGSANRPDSSIFRKENRCSSKLKSELHRALLLTFAAQGKSKGPVSTIHPHKGSSGPSPRRSASGGAAL